MPRITAAGSPVGSRPVYAIARSGYSKQQFLTGMFKAADFPKPVLGTDGTHTGYVTVLTYQRLAEVCAQYLRKGSAVLVEGRLQMREWTTPQGAKRQRLELRGESVHFLEKVSAPAAPESARSADDESRLF